MDQLDVNTQLVVYKAQHDQSKADFNESIRENERLKIKLDAAERKTKDMEAKLSLARTCYDDTGITKGDIKDFWREIAHSKGKTFYAKDAFTSLLEHEDSENNIFKGLKSMAERKRKRETSVE